MLKAQQWSEPAERTHEGFVPSHATVAAFPAKKRVARSPTPQKPLDKLDLRILEVLQRDAMIPVADLAEQVLSSKSVVWRRIQDMVAQGVIQHRVALVDPRSVGLNVIIFVRVRMDGNTRDTVPNFVNVMQSCPEVVECHSLLGDIDFLLKVIARSLDDYQDFFARKLSRINGVREVISSVSVSQPVATTQLPLRWLASAQAV